MTFRFLRYCFNRLQIYFVQKVLPPAKTSFQDYRASGRQSNPKRHPFYLKQFRATRGMNITQTSLFRKSSDKKEIKTKLPRLPAEKIGQFENIAKLGLTIIKRKL